MKKSTFERKLDGHATVNTFHNEHGEIFQIYRTDGPFQAVLLCGDETDGQMQPLFHPNFDIFSNEELYKLGAALQKLSGIEEKK